MTWNRNDELAKIQSSNLPYDGRVIKSMWVYQHDYEIQGGIYAQAKTYYERTKAALVVSLTAADGEGRKLSVAAAEQHAESIPDVWNAALAYRTAEQMRAADKEALNILHAELDTWRTHKADERAADQFIARTQP